MCYRRGPSPRPFLLAELSLEQTLEVWSVCFIKEAYFTSLQVKIFHSLVHPCPELSLLFSPKLTDSLLIPCVQYLLVNGHQYAEPKED